MTFVDTSAKPHGTHFIKSVLTLIFSAFLFANGLFAENAHTKITFIHFNDLNQMVSNNGRGGLAKVATLVADERSLNKNVIVTFGGDFLEPNLMTAIYRGAPMIELFNQLELDVMVVGDQDLNYGPKVLEERIQQANFPFLSSNIINKNDATLEGAKKSMILEMDGYHIGFIGLTSQSAMENTTTGNFLVTEPISAAIAEADILRDAGADIIVAIAHTNDKVDRELIATGNFDIILGGYDEILAVGFYNDTLFIESDSQAENIPLIDLYLKRNGSSGVDWFVETRTVNSRLLEPAPAFIASARYHEDILEQFLSKELGIAETVLDSRPETVLYKESAIGNLFADAICDQTDSDICFVNGGAIRGNKLYPAGTLLTRKELLSELPFVDTTMVLEVTGHVVVEALENAFSKLDKTLEEGAGRFLHLSGMSIVVDPKAPPGNKIIRVTRDGQLLDMEATYQLALNHFLATGGDEYEMFLDQKVLVNKATGNLELEHISTYLLGAGTVSPKVESRIIYQQ